MVGGTEQLQSKAEQASQWIQMKTAISFLSEHTTKQTAQIEGDLGINVRLTGLRGGHV